MILALMACPRFNGGVVGYFGYETIGYIEPRPAGKEDALGCPDILLMVPEEIPVFDCLSGKMLLSTHANSEEADAYGRAVARLNDLAVKLRDILLKPDKQDYPRRVEESDFISGLTPEQNLALEQDLLADPKELAEHLMRIDLGRNDAGRVAEIGTLRLTDKMIVERYSHVMHIVSNVTGQLQPGKNAFDVLTATFPAGTASGAPKIRAMEIINALEPVKRGVYSGAVGYIAWSGNLDTAIAIRTAAIKDKMLHIQAGSGIVYDSVPRNEWDETLNKSRAIFRAASMAEAGLEGEHA